MLRTGRPVAVSSHTWTFVFLTISHDLTLFRFFVQSYPFTKWSGHLLQRSHVKGGSTLEGIHQKVS